MQFRTVPEANFREWTLIYFTRVGYWLVYNGFYN